MVERLLIFVAGIFLLACLSVEVLMQRERDRDLLALTDAKADYLAGEYRQGDRSLVFEWRLLPGDVLRYDLVTPKGRHRGEVSLDTGFDGQISRPDLAVDEAHLLYDLSEQLRAHQTHEAEPVRDGVVSLVTHWTLRQSTAAGE